MRADIEKRDGREERGAWRSWKATFTVHFTAGRDNLSSYFLCSNDSNEVGLGSKFMELLGMRRI